jgi:hypothetical protein
MAVGILQVIVEKSVQEIYPYPDYQRNLPGT